MSNEIWKDIPGYEGLYQASNMGRIRSVDRHVGEPKKFKKGIILKTDPIEKGYVRVRLHKNNVGRKFLVHRLILLTFVGKIEKQHEVNHLNGIRDDNRIVNLEYCSHSENLKHAYRTGIAKMRDCKGSNNNMARFTEWDIRVMRRLYKNTTYWNQKRIAELFKSNSGSICQIIKYKTWRHI